MSAETGRWSCTWPHPGTRNERRNAPEGPRGGFRAAAGAGAAAWGAAAESGTCARRPDGTAGRIARVSERSSRTRHREPEEWRERVGIEPTGAVVDTSIAVLKTGRTTRPDPLPLAVYGVSGRAAR